MRPNNQRRQRGRNNGGGKQKFPSRNQSYDSNGPDVRVRGTAHQIYEKYMALAREATTSGDRILAESYYQYAEHYFRVIAAQGGFVRPSFDRMWDDEGGGEDGAPQGEGRPMEGQGDGTSEAGPRPEGGEQRRYDDRGGYNERQQSYGGERGPNGGYDNRRNDQRRQTIASTMSGATTIVVRTTAGRRWRWVKGPREGGYDEAQGEGSTPIPIRRGCAACPMIRPSPTSRKSTACRSTATAWSDRMACRWPDRRRRKLQRMRATARVPAAATASSGRAIRISAASAAPSVVIAMLAVRAVRRQSRRANPLAARNRSNRRARFLQAAPVMPGAVFRRV